MTAPTGCTLVGPKTTCDFSSWSPPIQDSDFSKSPSQICVENINGVIPSNSFFGMTNAFNDVSSQMSLTCSFANSWTLELLSDSLTSNLSWVEEMSISDCYGMTLASGALSALTGATILTFLAGSFTSLSGSAFSNMTSLQTLYMYANMPLSGVPAGLFSGLTSLQTLDMSRTPMYRHLEPAFGFGRPRQIHTRGRPLFYISREQLTHFVEQGFTSTQMAGMLHVSKDVVKRRLRHFGLNIRATYSTLSNEELDEKVRELVAGNRNLGQRMVQAMLLTAGHRVQRRRVADSLIRIDEEAVALRWARAIQRRTYQVSGPNSLWHIDGNHKLIRWGFVIHGGIDGFSRLITFLTVATNNKSATMLESFVDGTARYGIPSRVRSDHGLENTGVGAFMLSYRGGGRGSFITGRSVHNQRIERMWRDMTQSCTSVFKELFHHLEEIGDLNPNSRIHRWSLQYVYRPRIQRALDTFREAWNNHRLRSEGGKSPNQLYVEGIHRLAGQGHVGIDDLVLVDEPAVVDEDEFGVDEEGLVVEEPNHPVEVDVQSPLTNDQLDVLRTTVNPLDGNDLGDRLYRETLAFINNLSD